MSLGLGRIKLRMHAAKESSSLCRIAAEDDVSAEAAAGGARGPTALILEPARDLAEQTHNCVTAFKKHLVSPR